MRRNGTGLMGLGVGGCVLIMLALIAIRILSLIYSIEDLASGHPTHEAWDIILILVAW